MGIWRRRRLSLPRPGFKQSGAKSSVQSACKDVGLVVGLVVGAWKLEQRKESVLQTPTHQSGEYIQGSDTEAASLLLYSRMETCSCSGGHGNSAPELWQITNDKSKQMENET